MAIAASAAAVVDSGGRGDVHREVELVGSGALVQRVGHDEGAGQVLLAVDALDGQRLGGAVEEPELDRVADSEVPVSGLVVIDQDPVGLE